MFHLTQPTAQQIDAFLDSQRDAPFSYPAVGATRGEAPAGYNVDRNRVELGMGAETFQRALLALRTWRMMTLGWSSVQPREASIEVGTTVAVVAHHYGFWSLNACRIVYVMDEETNGMRRTGFAYGTLPAHGALGEERFSIEWHQADDSVWYDLYAFSRPAHKLARLGYPLGRRLQRRFAQASKRAMVDASRASSLI